MDPFINPIFDPLFSEYPLRLGDIGAAGTLRFPWSQASKFLHVYAFEPGARAEDIKKDRHATIFPVALSDHSGAATLYETKKPDASSLLRPVDTLRSYGGWDRFTVVKEYPVPVDTLDHVVEENNIPYIDFLKIDTQGTEWQVLKGAEKVLRGIYGIHLEVNFYGRYEGQAYFSDIDPWLRERGFVLYDLERRYLKLEKGLEFGGPKGTLMKGDALYLRDPQVINTLGGLDGREQKACLLRKIAIALLYGYVDVALRLYQMSKELFSSDEQGIMEKFFARSKSISTKIPAFPGRVRLAKVLQKLGSGLEPRSCIGTSGDNSLGNR